MSHNSSDIYINTPPYGAATYHTSRVRRRLFFLHLRQSAILDTPRGIGRIELLALGHESRQALDELSLRLVVHNVRHVFGEDLFAASSSVNAGHGDADRLSVLSEELGPSLNRRDFFMS